MKKKSILRNIIITLLALVAAGVISSTPSSARSLGIIEAMLKEREVLSIEDNN